MHERSAPGLMDIETAETEPSLGERLHAAALDLRLAIRKQVAKTQEFYNKKQLVDYDKRKAAVMRHGGDPQLVEGPTMIDGVETRRRVRNLFRLPLGTEETSSGRLVAHFAYIYEDQVSARRPNGADKAHLTLVHVKKQPDHDDGIREGIYDIKIVGDSVSVTEDARLLDEEELEKPLRLIQAARELYY